MRCWRIWVGSVSIFYKPSGSYWRKSIGNTKEDVHWIKMKLSFSESDAATLNKPFLSLHNFSPENNREHLYLLDQSISISCNLVKYWWVWTRSRLSKNEKVLILVIWLEYLINNQWRERSTTVWEIFCLSI